MSSAQAQVLEKTQKDIHLKKMDIVQIGNIPTLQKNGSLAFTLPRFGKVKAKATRVEYIDDDNFKWFGEIVGEGNVMIYNQNGNISGYITLRNNSYYINALVKGTSILAEMDTEKLKGKICSGIGAAHNNRDTPIKSLSNRVDPCTQVDRIRVLVVYTQLALDAVGLATITSRVNASIDQFNQASWGSGVTNPRGTLELVGIEFNSFVERIRTADATPNDNDIQDVTDLPTFTEGRRTATNSDIIVCLVAADYTTSRGIARAINAEYENGFAVVDVNFIPGQPVFPHEVGHLLGGRHDTDPNSGDAHGYEYSSKCTLMCPEKPSSTIRALHWSNPNISDYGVATGTATTNNVARSISANADRLANFRPAVTTTIQANISGPSYVYSYGPVAYSPIVSCGTGTYSYYWDRSYDGFNYFGGSNFENYGFQTYPSNNYNVHIRLRVTGSNGQVTAAYATTTFPNGVGSRLSADNNSIVLNEKTNAYINEDINTKKLIQVVYPNPSNGNINTKIFLSESDNVKLSIIGQQGQEISVIHQGELLAGVHNFDVSTHNLPIGQYFIRASTSHKIESEKIIILK